MAYYGGIWNTDKVLIELKKKGETLILRRTRGLKNKQKEINIKVNNLGYLLEAVVEAYNNQPERQIFDSTPIAIVDGGCGLLKLEWSPYWYGTTNALMIRGKVNQCIAIEQEDLGSFCRWFIGQVFALGNLEITNLS